VGPSRRARRPGQRSAAGERERGGGGRDAALPCHRVEERRPDDGRGSRQQPGEREEPGERERRAGDGEQREGRAEPEQERGQMPRQRPGHERAP
jgi:hypothetical protein